MAARLDIELVDRGLAPSRTRAQALIASGLVNVDGSVATTAAQQVGEATELAIKGSDHPWASRAGVKLQGALDEWGIECRGRVALDAGASTGGFVSVLLAREVARVYAVDVGYGQLLTTVAMDPRVVIIDRTNIRTLEVLAPPVPDLVTLDLSFISLRTVLPNIARLAPGAEVVALFKPQFEVGRKNVGAGGIVRDAAVVEKALAEFAAWVVESGTGTNLHTPVKSQLPGAKGNQEWFVHLSLKLAAAP
jgi:23S rRNA (cytidine1920-2'-O)/16S rRNA (cytidine1409-2'-O)-methyltransferase